MAYEPVLPWVAPFLFGMAAANFGLSSFATSAAGSWKPSAWPGQILSWAGRHSLAIYLIHQPLMFGTLALVAQALSSNGQIPEEGDRPFLDACQATCLDRNNDNKVYCRSYCACTAEELKRRGLWAEVLSERLTPDQRGRFVEAMQLCVKVQSPR